LIGGVGYSSGFCYNPARWELKNVSRRKPGLPFRLPRTQPRPKPRSRRPLLKDYARFLDWGNIGYQLYKKRPIVDRELYNTAHALRDALNALAHNDLVSLDVIMSGVLERPIEDV